MTQHDASPRCPRGGGRQLEPQPLGRPRCITRSRGASGSTRPARRLACTLIRRGYSDVLIRMAERCISPAVLRCSTSAWPLPWLAASRYSGCFLILASICCSPRSGSPGPATCNRRKSSCARLSRRAAPTGTRSAAVRCRRRSRRTGRGGADRGWPAAFSRPPGGHPPARARPGGRACPARRSCVPR